MATPGSKGKKATKSKSNSTTASTPPKRKKAAANADDVATVAVEVGAPQTLQTKGEIVVTEEVVDASITTTITTGTTTTQVQQPTAPAAAEKTVPIFKDPNFIHSSKGAAGGKKTRIWKNLKQIIAGDRLLPWKPDDVTYGSIDAPPSFKSGKKYSDLSGLEALYIDPQTNLRYATAEEFSRIRILPGDIVNGYLALRKANTPVP